MVQTLFIQNENRQKSGKKKPHRSEALIRSKVYELNKEISVVLGTYSEDVQALVNLTPGLSQLRTDLPDSPRSCADTTIGWAIAIRRRGIVHG
ncbi:hypothetical protein [Yersinia enterocolitica]|uniref:hypothetical protein n=1 Tax=Yersinia enterocolitica TaxID=630 RepID=UPI0029AEF313|nr:hypothetical protein [Yersinia enterocolitica]